MPASRRAVLLGLGIAAGLGFAGCSENGSQRLRYVLSARNVPGPLSEALIFDSRSLFPEADERLLDRLICNGLLTTMGFAL